MNPETEQRLATLEVLLEEEIRYSLPCHEDSATLKPYAWDATIKGEFTPLNMIKSEGWIIETDPEVAFANWLWTEQNGLASSRIHVCNKDPRKFLLDEHSKNQRYQQYSHLLKLLTERIKDLQAFSLSYNSHYSLSVVVGRVPDSQRWICLSSTVPQETPKFINELIHCSPYKEEKQSSLEAEKLSNIEKTINNMIKELGKIMIYGYYDGGYHNFHHHSIVLASGDSQEEAINNVLLKSGLVEIYKVEKFMILGDGGWGFFINDRYFDHQDNVTNLIEFLNTMFPELLLYRFCFWDYEHLYILGKTGDFLQYSFTSWVGVAIHSQFTYNP
jgi:hypothetical protein